MRHEYDKCDMCVDPYSATEQQIRADAMLSRQLQEEEKVHLRMQANQIEKIIYHIMLIQSDFDPSQNKTF